MIYDKLENLKKYNLEFINTYLESQPEFRTGKINIDGEEKFAIGLEYETKNAELGLWEAHRKYLDIQVILEGEEILYINDITNMESTKEYEDDYQLFKGEKEQEILLRSGYFLALYPNEVHKTAIQVNEPVKVKKLVFKKLL